jgi:hypothetical protein
VFKAESVCFGADIGAQTLADEELVAVLPGAARRGFDTDAGGGEFHKYFLWLARRLVAGEESPPTGIFEIMRVSSYNKNYEERLINVK